MALPVDRLIPMDKFPQAARRFVQPDAPTRLKDMMASGLVPLKPVVQICALYQIAISEEGTLRDKAVHSALTLPSASVSQLVQQPMLPQVLDWLASIYADNKPILRAVLLNPVTDDDTVLRIADTADEATCDLIAQNQIRLLRSPSLIEALYFNPSARASTVDRMLDFAARNQLVLPAIPDYEAIVAEVGGQGPQTDAEAAETDAAFRDAQDAIRELVGDGSDKSVEQAGKVIAEGLRSARDFDAADADQELAAKKQSAAGRIRKLNIAQKVRLALMGTSTERAILIRDTNKVVARTVIRSPAVTDAEAMVYAKNKSLIDEVISFIASNRKWTRHYGMKLNLIKNPKTPTSDALRFLSHLRISDLRLVAKSRDVPGPIAKAAKNLVKTRSH